MLPYEAAYDIVPRPGTILVRRDENPEFVTRYIIAPASVRGSRKASTGMVWAVGAGVTGLAPGARVLLAGGVGKKVKFGERDELELYHCRPGEVACLLRGEEEAKVIEQRQHIAGREQGLDPIDHEVADEKRDHGQAYSPR